MNVAEFINSFTATEQKREDSFKLVELMQNLTGVEPKMWGPTIIGFGSYHYKYKSGHEDDAPLIGFSPRKKRIFALCFYMFGRTQTFVAKPRKIQKRESLYLYQKTCGHQPEQTNEIKKRGNGKIDHIAFDVDNIEETFTMLKSNSFL